MDLAGFAGLVMGAMYVYLCFVLAYATRVVPRLRCDELLVRYGEARREVRIMSVLLVFLSGLSAVGLRLAVSPGDYFVLMRQVMLIYVSTLVTYVFFTYVVLRTRVRMCEQS